LLILRPLTNQGVQSKSRDAGERWKLILSGNDGNLAVALNDRELDLFQLLYPLTGSRSFHDVSFNQSSITQSLMKELSVLDNDGGLTIDQS
jgi:hypothetical protein